MADLTENQASAMTKVIGSDSTGQEQTPVQSTSNGGLHSNLRDNSGTELATNANPVKVDGNAASGATDAGNPIKIGGVYNTTRPSLSTGQRADAQTDNRGAVLVTSEDVAPVTQNITTQDIASTISTGANSQSIITGTPTANSVASFALSSDSAIVVQVMGTWTGTLQTEVSMDGGTTWLIRFIHQTGTVFTSSAFAANFAGVCNTSGYTNFRIRATAAMTGTATVKLIQTDNSNVIYVGSVVQNSPVDGTKTTYSASIVGAVPALLATDVVTIAGSASKTIRITRISMTLTTTAGSGIGLNISLVKRSTLNTGGTSTTQTDVPHDSNNVAGTATVKSYSVNPVALGTAVGTVRTIRYAVAASNSIDLIEWTFGNRPSQALVLRGSAENLALNFNATTVTGGTLNVDVEWTEE